jgi:hypothetical protein
MATLSTKSEKLHQISRAQTPIKQKQVFVSLCDVCMAFTKKITCNTKENQLSQSFLFKQERRGDSQCVITNRLTCQQALCNRRPTCRHRPCLLSSTTAQTHVQCNQSTRFYENLDVSKLVKMAINTAITVKQFKSKVTLLNT